jgi:hypothetical protein
VHTTGPAEWKGRIAKSLGIPVVVE